LIMRARGQVCTAGPGFPRYFRVGRHRVNSYKVFLCVGIYLAILASAAVAQRSGLSPLRVGAGCLLCAVVGMAGARVYHVAVHFRVYRKAGLWAAVPNQERSGWNVLGGLAIVPFTLMLDSMFGIPLAVFWDHMAVGIAVGAAWVRFGCVCNGCCVGKESEGWFAFRQHDAEGIYKRRIPAQWLEIGWWLMAVIGLIWLWPRHLPPGCYALGVLAWYGAGRVWLELLREQQDIVFGRVRVDQVVAALLALVAGGGLIWRTI
jgi:phosphatidylglycerol:prolipoprotein diacylglycerol transferase